MCIGIFLALCRNVIQKKMKILNTTNKNNHYGKKVIIVLPIFLVLLEIVSIEKFHHFWCLFTIAITLLNCSYNPTTICKIYI
jgi:hypothetical protein